MRALFSEEESACMICPHTCGRCYAANYNKREMTNRHTGINNNLRDYAPQVRMCSLLLMMSLERIAVMKPT